MEIRAKKRHVKHISGEETRSKKPLARLLLSRIECSPQGHANSESDLRKCLSFVSSDSRHGMLRSCVNNRWRRSSIFSTFFTRLGETFIFFFFCFYPFLIGRVKLSVFFLFLSLNNFKWKLETFLKNLITIFFLALFVNSVVDMIIACYSLFCSMTNVYDMSRVRRVFECWGVQAPHIAFYTGRGAFLEILNKLLLCRTFYRTFLTTKIVSTCNLTMYGLRKI